MICDIRVPAVYATGLAAMGGLAIGGACVHTGAKGSNPLPAVNSLLKAPEPPATFAGKLGAASRGRVCHKVLTFRHLNVLNNSYDRIYL